MQGYQVPPPDAGGEAAPRESLDIQFRSTPIPRNGDNMFEVTVKDAGGHPVTDAEVAVRLYMAPMPSMNMPAMQSDVARLGHVAERRSTAATARAPWPGAGMSTVTVTRGGQRLGTRQTTTVAR